MAQEEQGKPPEGVAEAGQAQGRALAIAVRSRLSHGAGLSAATEIPFCSQLSAQNSGAGKAPVNNNCTLY